MHGWNPETEQYDRDYVTEIAIEGLMAMGYTQEEALAEIRKNDEARMDQAEAEWWNTAGAE